MNKYFLIALFSCLALTVNGQKIVKQIKASVTSRGMEAKLRFLASDELRGRDVGKPGLDIAARYIAEHFRANGLQSPDGVKDYYQAVPFVNSVPPSTLTLKQGANVAVAKKDLVFLAGENGDYQGQAVFLNYGLEADYSGVDVQGKVVVVLPGDEEGANPRRYRRLSSKKRQLAAEAGAIGVVELYKSQQTPWRLMMNFLSRPGMRLDEGATAGNDSVFLLWLQDIDGSWENRFRSQSEPVSIQIAGGADKSVNSQNVIGWIEGKHSDRKNEYLVMTAHYDHVGVTYRGADQDSIFNGARDNAIGVATLLETASLFAQNRPDYSVVFIAFTGEEKGLLGSSWYVEHPVFPLEQTFFNFNTDGGGYNDTSIATVIGYERTSVKSKLDQSVKPFGLQVIGDPVPEQGLFDRSDNVNFAVKGIPALTFSCGIRSFDEEIMKYYHQAADEVSSLDMNYVEQYARSFVYAAYLIANGKEKPFWNSGDKYEAAGKALYGME